MSGGNNDRRSRATPVALAAQPHWLRQSLDILPRPLRFLGVGGIGLLTDLGIFTAIPLHGAHPIATRCVSLAIATLVTWRLNRAVTFNASGRRQHDEAMRYAAVTAMSQGTSFAIFSALVLTVLAPIPQLAVIAGAACGAAIAYTGHTLFAFAPRRRTIRDVERSGAA